MRQKSFSRYRGSVREILFILALIFIIVAVFMIHPRPHRHYAYQVKQVAQLHSVSTALELHSNELGDYPPSEANDPTGVPYCGALKLCEAVMGQDFFGFHSNSAFRADGRDAMGAIDLYPDVDRLSAAERDANLEARKGPYVQLENANTYRLADIYGKGQTGAFDENLFVLCDTYIRKRPGGAKTGMPILYYRANPKGTAHDVNDPDSPANIYDFRDNRMLLNLGVPDEPNAVHPLADARRFYINTQNDKPFGPLRPYNPDKFILISAGYDGLYGTADDICNFEWKYRE
ncbi:MAG: hypothetical protein JSW27_16225 [Phycisphaerales bacterium]|nr:MAG: hypothetical protein JSW27_16225 [Phycisphaerales bacterium]